MEDKFTENLYHRVIRDLTDWVKNQGLIPLSSPSLKKSQCSPETGLQMKLMNLLTETEDSWGQVSGMLAETNQAVDRYNIRLSNYYRKNEQKIQDGLKPLEEALTNGKYSKDDKVHNGHENQSENGNFEVEEIEKELPGPTQNLSWTLTEQRRIEKELRENVAYINCDVRSFNFEWLRRELGSFDVLVVDPPWRIKGGQKNDSPFMFSNSSFSLEYNTMSNAEISDLPFEKLSEQGFLFLWILANQVDSSVGILEKWGYALVDILVWAKVREGKVWLSHGYYFMHSFELCLVGYKCPPRAHVEFHSKVSSNLLFAEFRAKSQKPDELYEVIETMMPGARKIEIFARNHNLRPGWLAVGNQLGPQFARWEHIVSCNDCHKPLDAKAGKRFKAKKLANFDLCEDCLAKGGRNSEDFYHLHTTITEDILHQYHACNFCGTEPIWGVRFRAEELGDFDLCEGKHLLISLSRQRPRK